MLIVVYVGTTGGLLFIGLPFNSDAVVFNSHRLYGPVRLPLVSSNPSRTEIHRPCVRAGDGVAGSGKFIVS